MRIMSQTISCSDINNPLGIHAREGTPFGVHSTIFRSRTPDFYSSRCFIALSFSTRDLTYVSCKHPFDQRVALCGITAWHFPQNLISFSFGRRQSLSPFARRYVYSAICIFMRTHVHACTRRHMRNVRVTNSSNEPVSTANTLSHDAPDNDVTIVKIARRDTE